MNRRNFFRIGAVGAMALPQFPERLLAGEDAENDRRRGVSPLDRAPGLVRKALTSAIAGFPTIEPVFGGIFLPGGNLTQLIGANGFSSLNTQVQTLAAQGYRLASLTAIRNMNATWYYASFSYAQGGVNYVLLRTSDPNQFQQTFTMNKTGYRLVDFTITWDQNQLYYVGYWLAVTSPVNQTLVWDLDWNDLIAQWNTLSPQGMRMTRIQPFPQRDAAAFSALFEAGNGAYVLWESPLPDFAGDTTAKFSGLSLVGLGYDAVDGNMIGCWRDKVASAQFVWNQDWNTLQGTAQQMAASGLILSAISAYPNAPDFDGYFAANLAPFVMGYAYAVGYNGQVSANGYGFARSPNQPQNGNTAFTPTSRCNLASISKAITGIALEVLILKYPSVTLDTPFWPLISSMVPNPDPSVKPVTLRNLATMKSGMLTPPIEGPLSGNLWPYLNAYLAQPLVGTPGVTYSYNNENFTILQGVIDQVTGQDYVTWVTQNVLVPAGIDTSIFNPNPDPIATATLLYGGPNDTRPGGYFGPLNFVAPGGWISTAQELLKIPLALRNTSVLPAAAISEMLNDGIGWFSYAGSFGTYYDKDGGLSNGATPPQTLNTCIVRLAEGYDIALVANTQPPTDVREHLRRRLRFPGLADHGPAAGDCRRVRRGDLSSEGGAGGLLLDQRLRLYGPGGNRLDQLDYRLYASYFRRRDQRQRERETRVRRVHQRESSKFPAAVERRGRDRRRATDHANRSDELDARDRRPGARDLRQPGERRGLRGFGIRHRKRRGLRGPRRRMAGICQPPRSRRRHHRVVRHGMRTHESRRARRSCVLHAVSRGESRGVSGDHRRTDRFRALRRSGRPRLVATECSNPVRPHRRRSTAGVIGEQRRVAAERDAHGAGRVARISHRRLFVMGWRTHSCVPRRHSWRRWVQTRCRRPRTVSR